MGDGLGAYDDPGPHLGHELIQGEQVRSRAHQRQQEIKRQLRQRDLVLPPAHAATAHVYGEVVEAIDRFPVHGACEEIITEAPRHPAAL